MPKEFRTSDTDKTRPCVHCRMMISVLATRCRYCGAEVGRPRPESRTMTVEDLGGESQTRYAPSATVMEALESFRSEEEMKAPASDPGERKSAVQRGKGKPQSAAPQARAPRDDGLPELDERSQALASLSVSPVRPKAVARKSQGPSWIKRAGVFAGLVAAMVVLTFGALQVRAFFRSDNSAPVTGPRFPNRAKDILESGGAPLDALEEAVKAQQKEDISENRQVTLKARRLVIEQIRELLDQPQYKHENLTQAAAMANKAVSIDPSDDTRAIKEEVDRECYDYGTQLKRTERSLGTATFLLSGTNSREDATVVAREGETFAGRFKLVRIEGDYVRALDEKRGSRYLTFRTDGSIE